ncbi:unnamed protein product [marine sediment metagenome]|uniref:Uncharacterized protein n=1 Tax=marine sediment metagenome TaxID=412755 RepID=X1C407_9ZZZZ
MKKILFLTFGVLITTNIFAQRASCDLIQPITFAENQNIYRFVAKQTAYKPLISARKQTKYKKNFFQHFFSPWKISRFGFTKSAASYRKDQAANINRFRHNLGRGENYQLNPRSWFNEIVANMDILKFPNINRNAITVHNAALRYMPTTDPHFDNPHIAGQGYPFDDFQKSMLMVGTPIHIYQISKQGDCAFVWFIQMVVSRWVMGLVRHYQLMTY